MAVQAGMATSRLVILLGTGITGTLVLKNSKLSDFISDLSKVFSKHIKEREKNSSSDDSSLSAQLSRLSQEVMLLRSRNVTVVNGTQSGNASSLAVPVVVIGIAGYGYFWWKGWSFSDVMYVTRRNMANVVSSVSKQLETVTNAVQATKKHLTSRIDNVSRTLDDSMAVQGIIKDEVFEIRSDVARVGGDIGSVQQIVEGLGVQLDEVQSKQDFTNKGIILLCQLAQKWEETSNELPGVYVPKKIQGVDTVDSILEGMPPLPKGRLEKSSTIGGSGLKQLQFISDTLSGKTPSVTDVTEAASKPKLQRTYTPDLYHLRRSQTTY